MSEENGIGGGGRKRIDNDYGTTKQASGQMYKKRTRDVKSKKQSNKGIEVSDSHCFHHNCIVSYLHPIACKEDYCDPLLQMVGTYFYRSDQCCRTEKIRDSRSRGSISGKYSGSRSFTQKK